MAVAELLTLPEVADRVRVSERTLRRHTSGQSEPSLAVVRVGRQVRVRPEALEQWIDDLAAAANPSPENGDDA